MSLEKQSLKQWVIDIGSVIIGTVINAVSVNCFTVPNKIAAGGATGLATVLYYLFNMPVGISIILINIPLFFISFKSLGKTFFAKTAIATLITSIMIDTLVFLPTYTEDRLLASVFGGALSGLGLSFIYMRGIMTGGTDLLARLFKIIYPHMTLGRLLLVFDAMVVFIAALVFKDVTGALYAVIVIFITSKVVDTLLSGIDLAKIAFIVSDKSSEIGDAIIKYLDRGATLLYAKGCYSGIDRPVLFCVVRIHEIFRLRQIVNEIDDKAFVVFSEATEVVGEGFKDITNH